MVNTNSTKTAAYRSEGLSPGPGTTPSMAPCSQRVGRGGTRVSVRLADQFLASILRPALVAAGCAADHDAPEIVIVDHVVVGVASLVLGVARVEAGATGDTRHDVRFVDRETGTWSDVVSAINELAPRNDRHDDPERVAVGIARPSGGILTARQLQVLQLVADGLSTMQAARRIGITSKTVNNHLGAVYVRLEAGNLTQAVLAAARLGLVELRSSTYSTT